MLTKSCRVGLWISPGWGYRAATHVGDLYFVLYWYIKLELSRYKAIICKMKSQLIIVGPAFWDVIMSSISSHLILKSWSNFTKIEINKRFNWRIVGVKKLMRNCWLVLVQVQTSKTKQSIKIFNGNWIFLCNFPSVISGNQWTKKQYIACILSELGYGNMHRIGHSTYITV